LAEHGVHAHADTQPTGVPGEFRAVGQVGAGDLVGGQAGQAERQQVVGVLLAQPGQVRGPLPVPGAEVGRHGGVHAADAGVAQRPHGGVGVRGGAGVVREVEHGGDARVDRGQRRQPGTGVHVLRPVDRRVAHQDLGDVAAEVVHVRHDPAQLGLPGVAVGVDEAGCRDHVGCVHDDRVLGGQVVPDRGDGRTLDQDVGSVEGAQ
jgi:hypothetical protein